MKAEKLSIVAREYWREEGCSSPDEFISIWQGIHPRKGWDSEQFVFLHEFELVRTSRDILSRHLSVNLAAMKIAEGAEA